MDDCGIVLGGAEGKLISLGRAAAMLPYPTIYPASAKTVRVGLQRVGKKIAGRLLDGVEHDGMPEIRACG